MFYKRENVASLVLKFSVGDVLPQVVSLFASLWDIRQHFSNSCKRSFDEQIQNHRQWECCN